MGRAKRERKKRKRRGQLGAKLQVAFSLIEVLIATALIATIIVAFLTLSASESRWTRDVSDRAKAVTLARNLIALVEGGCRESLQDGKRQSDGSYLTENVDQVLPEVGIALGSALFDWVLDKRRHGKFALELRWLPGPPDRALKPVEALGKVLCVVRWRSSGGEEKRVEMVRLVSR